MRDVFMKYLRLLVIFLVLLAVAYVLYQFSAPADDSAAKPAEAPAPVAAPKPMAPAMVALPKPSVVAPIVPPVIAAAQPAPAVAATTPKAIDYQPQPDLNGCIDQTLQLLEAKDVLSLVKTLMPPDAIQRVIASGQAGSVEDIAAMALMLVSDASSWISGQTIVIDGGTTNQPSGGVG